MSADERVWRDIKQVHLMAGGQLLKLDCGHSLQTGLFPDGRCGPIGIEATRAWCDRCTKERVIERLRHEAAVLRSAIGELVIEADAMLMGGQGSNAHQCSGCGRGSDGLLRRAIEKARGLAPKIESSIIRRLEGA
jgi:hypothetical protein